MIQVFHATLGVLFFFLSILPAQAGVRITVSEHLEPGRYLMVKTDIVNSDLNGSHVNSLGISFLQSGQSETLPVLAAMPLLSDKVTALALHPAYFLDSVTSRIAPNLVRTVSLPPLNPTSWRSLLDSGNPLPSGSIGITTNVVNDHFRQIIRDFLPAFDRAKVPEDLRRQLPLLRELATFVQTPQAQKNFARAQSGYDDSAKRVDDQYRIQILHRLQEIEGWLALDQRQRLPMHDWIDNFHKPDYVFFQIMQEFDRQKIHQILRQSAKPGHMRQHSWFNKETRVKFSFSLDTRAGDKQVRSYRTVLMTDLNPRLGLEGNTAYLRKCFPTFIIDGTGHWNLK